MSKLYLFNYNNYFNRIVKKESALADYGTPIYTLSCNFNPKDGITTSHDINYAHDDGDYVIITETINNTETIMSRWFVIEANRLRGGQYRLELKRDLIVDYFDNIKEAPIMLKKGMVTKTNNLIFNREGFNTNQIKVGNDYLTDSKNSLQWIYLYMAKNAGDISTNLNTTFTPYAYATITTPIANSIFASGTRIAHAKNIEFYLKVKYSELGVTKYLVCKIPFMINQTGALTDIIDLTAYSALTLEQIAQDFNEVLSSQYDTYCQTYINSQPSSYLNANQENTLANSNSQLIKDSTGTYYRMSITSQTSTITEDISLTSALGQSIRSAITSEYPSALFEAGSIYITYDKTEYSVSPAVETGAEYQINVTQSTHQDTKDSEYNIIAIPYTGKTATTLQLKIGVDEYVPIDTSLQLSMAQAIAQEATNQKVYDMQILPYGPFTDECNENFIDITNLNARLFETQSYGGTIRNVLFYVQWATFSNVIPYTINVPSYTEDENINYKICSEVEVCRLCSPNFNGVFEFNIAKNRGVEEFKIDITLKPYTPYIHIAPDFKGLYGQNFDDARGLICGGDFSLPITLDAFATYELQNKNYQIAFDRQIEHLEFTQGQEKTLGVVGAITGALGGTLGGIAGGTMVGGLAGGVAGGIIGGTASAVGGALDIAMMTARQAEDKSYAIDNFTYQLGNIKALPYSLNKVTPLNYNYQKFPIIERYTCTTEEINILINKIKYNGMTIEAIGTLEEFITNYVSSDKCFYSGKIIRLESLNLPAHEAFEIYKEIEKGVYI